MSKKILGLVVSVALLMVVLSGCFLLPQIDTNMPIVVINSPAYNQVFTVPTQQSTTSVVSNVTVYASSAIRSVQISLLMNGQPVVAVNANGPYGQNNGSFSYTFKNLSVGSYKLSAQAYSQCKTPSNLMYTQFTITSTQTTPSTTSKYAAPT
uniref:hypothetical protein n=1 Tax=Athalassotoga sp. TaxID=2022597 RepID=UPI003D00833A